MDISISEIDIYIKNFLDKEVEKAKFIPQITLQWVQQKYEHREPYLRDNILKFALM